MDGPIDLKSPDAEAKLAKSTKPLVVLLDGKHFDVEWGILKDVATCAHINAKSLDEIPDKVSSDSLNRCALGCVHCMHSRFDVGV